MKTFNTCKGLRAIFPRLVLLLISSLSLPSLYAQPSGSFWTSIAENAIIPRGQRHIIPQKYQTLSLNINSMHGLLARAPHEKNTNLRNSAAIIVLPAANGKLVRFRFVETATMQPELAARFPQIHTYTAIGVDDPSLSATFDLTPAGFHGMIHSVENGLDFIDPYSAGDVQNYIVYAKKDYVAGPDKAFYEPAVLGTETENAKKIRRLVEQRRAEKMQAQSTGTVERPSGDQLRTYRIAIAATGEYTAFHGGTVSAALAAITTTLNRVNFIYIREVDVRMTLVASNNLIVYTNGSTDPYSNGNAGAMISQVQADIDAKIGNANYDIGHIFGTNSGGIATLASVCQAGYKARGVTGSAAPVGDAFDVDYVAHEIGHQFGANHTFNGNAGACAGGNRNAATAFEPGSGSTIMAYAGICSPQDLQPNSDAYFHTESYEEIFAFTESGSGSGCAVITSPANSAPVPTIVTTNNLTIPKSTPFTITGSATDAQNDPITYCWEQYDLGPAGSPTAPSGDAPIFRSFTGTGSPSRTFPKLSDLLNNTSTIGEVLPTYARTLHFNLTVRDNYSGGGGVNWAYPLNVNVSGTAGPFVVTYPNTAVTLPAGSVQTVTWNVAGTTAAPISTANVNIRLSTDGGVTFPTVLLANTPNDGTQSITLPGIGTSTARIKVEAAGNIYFDISNSNFTIAQTAAAPAISSFAPASGPAGVGVMIKGTNFMNVTAVKFNGVAAIQYYPAGSTLLYATVPAGATTGKIQVVTSGGTATSVASFTVASISSAWTAKATLAVARSQHGAIATNGKVYVFGGWNSSGVLNSLEIYNPVTNTWSAGAPLPVAVRGMSFALGNDGKIYAISGVAGAYVTNVYRYTPSTNSWAAVAPIPAAVWEGAAAATASGKIYVFGGLTPASATSNSTRIYDIATNTWSTGANMPVGVLQHSAVTGSDGKIYVIGGRTSSSAAPSGTVQIYNPATNTWSAGAPMTFPKTQFGAAKAGDGRIYVAGGKVDYVNNNGPFFHTVEIYNPATNTWVAGPVTRAPAGELEALNLNGNLYAIGGTDGTFRNYNFQLFLAPTITSFSPTSGPVGTGVAIKGTRFINVSSVRFNGVAATEFYVAGSTLLYATVPATATTGKIEVAALDGTGQSVANFTVAPISSAWIAKTALVNGRAQHGAVAANGKVYVFGGYNASGPLSSLEIYNAATNSWSAGAPMPVALRGMSFALGSNGLIYSIGGVNAANASVTNTYSYNPATNTWTTLAGIPLATWEGAAAASSGGKVYVFGGENPANVTGAANTTRIYTIATNTWSTGTNMPVAVKQHSALTGADGRIYIIGGRSASSGAPVGNVQIYNPATNTWSAGAAMITPKVQSGAVLGSNGKIYVIGGKAKYPNNSGPFFHTVEVYTPATNSWAAGPVIPRPVGELEAVSLNDNIHALCGTDGTFRNYNFQLILPPAAPAALTASALSASKIRLTWTDNAKNETGYVVERATAAAGPFAVIASPLPVNTISYTDTGLTAGVTRYYRVKATNTAGSSAYSNTAFATTNSSRPADAPVTTIGEQQGPDNRLSVLPNPVTAATKVSFTVNKDQQVQLSVYDIQGKLVEHLFRGTAEAGKTYQFRWNAGPHPAGMYFSRLVMQNGIMTQRMVLLSGNGR